MPINYPVSVDTLPTNRQNRVRQPVDADDINDIARYANAIGAELGINPSGVFADVAARLADVDTRVKSGSGSPEGIVTAPPGTIYRRTDPTLNVSPLWMKITGSGNTGWRSFDRARIDVEDWGADGTGATDSSAAFAMILALANENAVIYSKPNRTYKIASRLGINKATVWEFNQSVIFADAALASDTVLVSAAGVTWKGVVVDGNQASGRSSQSNVRWTGNGGLAINCEARNGTSSNWVISTNTVDLHGCRGVGSKTGYNFDCFFGGVMRQWNCYSEGALANYGVHIASDAGEGCIIDCHAKNDYQDFLISGNRGHVRRYTSEYLKNNGSVITGGAPRNFLRTAFGVANAELVFFCGLPGSHTAPTINVRILNPGTNNAALGAVWTGTWNNWTLTINLATTGAGSIATDQNQARYVIEAINNAVPPAAQDGQAVLNNTARVIEVALQPGNDGTGRVPALASTPLAGGSGNTPTGWQIDYIGSRRCGYNADGTVFNASASALVVAGGADIQIGTVESKDSQGYALGFGAFAPGRIPAARIQVGTVIASNIEAMDGGDPAVALVAGVHDITIGRIIVDGHTLALTLNESDQVYAGGNPAGWVAADSTIINPGTPVRNIQIGEILASRCMTGVISADNAAQDVTIGRVRAIDCSANLSHTAGAPARYGLLSFSGAGFFAAGSVNVSTLATRFVLTDPTIYEYTVNDLVTITGVGPAGADLSARITAISGANIDFTPAASTTNASATIKRAAGPLRRITIDSFEHAVTTRSGAWETLPHHLVYCDASATGIYVKDLKALGCRGAPVWNAGTGNTIVQRSPVRKMQIVSLDSTETWTASNGSVANNATAGQFVEGDGGKKLTPSGASTLANIVSPAISKDLSGLASDDWIRVAVYVENFADADVSSASIIRLTSNAAAKYSQRVVPGSFFTHDGLQYIHFRKRDITSVGGIEPVDWANVTGVALYVKNGAANTFKLTFDDVVVLEDA